MAACGGGGGGGGPGPEEITGNYFPIGVGDVWIYDGPQGERMLVRATGTRKVDGQDGVVVLTDTDGGIVAESIYVVSATGVRQVPVVENDPIARAIGPVEVLRYPLRAGDSFVQIDRTISTGMDFDGDGRIDPADVRSTVDVVGLESITTPLGSFDKALHVRTTIRVAVRPTGVPQTVTVDMTADDWFGLDIGPLRTTLATTSQLGDETERYDLTAWRVGARRSETTPPAVHVLDPADGARSGPIFSVRVEFDEWIDRNPTAQALTLADASGAPVPGTLNVGTSQLGFWPSVPLASGHYTATLGPDLADMLGNRLGTARSWSFTIDASGPQLVSVTPALGAVDVPRNATITLRFDEAIDPNSLPASNLSLGAPLAGSAPVSVAVNGDTAVLTPTFALARGTEYTLVLGTSGYGPRDLQGNAGVTGPVARFTTDYGRFSEPVLLKPDAGAEAVAAGDLNGDGRSDVVVAVGYDASDAQAFKFAVYLQSAGGTLPDAPQWIATRATYGCRPTSVALGDFDGDGRLDAAVAEFGCGVELFLQGADGVLRAGPFLPSVQSYLVRAADFDADGRTDLIAVGWNDSMARVWMQDASGKLVESATPAVQTWGWGTMAAGDLDGDGRADFAVTSGQGTLDQAVGVVLRRADGSFAPPMYLAVANLTLGHGVAIADVDGDGRNELVATLDGRVGIWREGGGALQRVADLPSASVGPVAVADLNGDGRRDIVVAHTSGCGIGVYLQQPGGGWGAESCYTTWALATGGDVLAIADVNSDGRPDIVMPRAVLLQQPVPMYGESLRRPGARQALGSGRWTGGFGR